MAATPSDWFRRTLELTRGSVVRVSMARFVLLSALALLVLGVGIRTAGRHIAEQQALDEATRRAQAVGRGIVSALVDPGLRARDPDSIQRVDRALSFRLNDGTFSHVVIFDARGRVLWSDVDTMIGERVPIDPELRDALHTGVVLPRPPNDEDRLPDALGDKDNLLEVHVPLPATEGGAVVFEAYIDSDRIADQRNAITKRTLPIALVGLLLFQLAILPLAWSLARRIDRARRDQADLVTRSLRAWHEERRRLAQDLHDGVVQDLSAVSYLLPTVTSALPDTPEGSAARHTIDRMIGLLQQDLHALRTMVLDLMPTDLTEIGLAAALGALADRYVDDSLDITVEVEEGLDLDEDVTGVVYRVVREGLRNVQKHARAGHARVTVSQDADTDTVMVLLTDDGRGLEPHDGDEGVGLRLLKAMVEDLGGTLDLFSAPAGGTAMRVRVPARLPE
jgi:signal transduction histidine kinase